MPEVIDNQPEPLTCMESTKRKTSHIVTLCTEPVTYPDDRAQGKGWCDVCNVTCSILCCGPKIMCILGLIPYVCFCEDGNALEDPRK
jgi:hypothetical protein